MFSSDLLRLWELNLKEIVFSEPIDSQCWRVNLYTDPDFKHKLELYVLYQEHNFLIRLYTCILDDGVYCGWERDSVEVAHFVDDDFDIKELMQKIQDVMEKKIDELKEQNDTRDQIQPQSRLRLHRA